MIALALSALVARAADAPPVVITPEGSCDAHHTAGYRLETALADYNKREDLEEALAKARQAATDNLVAAACAGRDESECAAIRRSIGMIGQAHDPSRRLVCAAVGLSSEVVKDPKRRNEFEQAIDKLAADAAKSVGADPVVVMPPRWSGGCPAGETASALVTALRSRLANRGVAVLEAEDLTLKTAQLTLELTWDGGGGEPVAVGAWLKPSSGGAARAIPGFDAQPHWLGPMPASTATCRGDAALGLAHGSRAGGSGLQVQVSLGSDNAHFCEGDIVTPRVQVSQPARVQVYSVAGDGRAWLVWPPPDAAISDRVSGALSLEPMAAMRLEGLGDETLLVLAVPAESAFPATDPWRGFCRSDAFGAAQYPGVAAAAVPFRVLPAGQGSCDPDAAADPALLAQIQEALDTASTCR